MLKDKILDGNTAVKENINHQLINNLDYGLNIFLLAIAAILGVLSIIDDTSLILMASWNLLLGAYQLISALVGTLRGNTRKGTYLIMAIVYLMLLWFGGMESSNLFPDEFEPIVLLFVIIPLVGAAYFTYLCYDAKKLTV